MPMNNRSKKKDTKLAGVRRAVSEKKVEVGVENNQAVKHENCSDQIEAVDRRWQEEVARLTDNIEYLQDMFESAQE